MKARVRFNRVTIAGAVEYKLQIKRHKWSPWITQCVSLFKRDLEKTVEELRDIE